jgi:hypothetical protein
MQCETSGDIRNQCKYAKSVAICAETGGNMRETSGNMRYFHWFRPESGPISETSRISRIDTCLAHPFRLSTQSWQGAQISVDQLDVAVMVTILNISFYNFLQEPDQSDHQQRAH